MPFVRWCTEMKRREKSKKGGEMRTYTNLSHTLTIATYARTRTYRKWKKGSEKRRKRNQRTGEGHMDGDGWLLMEMLIGLAL